MHLTFSSLLLGVEVPPCLTASPDTHHWQLQCGTSTSRGPPSIRPCSCPAHSISVVYILRRYSAKGGAREAAGKVLAPSDPQPQARQGLHLHAHHVLILVLYWHLSLCVRIKLFRMHGVRRSLVSSCSPHPTATDLLAGRFS
jgi:hypothetical protein